MKEYPLRKTDHRVLVDVCECGHHEVNHRFHEDSSDNSCVECTCPNYKFELKVEWREYCTQIGLEREKKTKSGNTV